MNKIQLPIEQIIYQYTMENKSAVELGKIYGVSDGTIKNRLKENKISINNNHVTYTGEKRTNYGVCCEIDCTEKATRYYRKHKKHYCDIHYYQWCNYNKTLEQSKGMKNKIVFKENMCKIAINDKHGNIILWAIVDLDDYNLIKDYKWCVSDNRIVTHIYPNGKRTPIRMHNLIMNFVPDDNTEIDHINRVPYDNRRSNLRVVSRAQNSINKNILNRNTSGVKGVAYHSLKNKWRAYIKAEDKYRYKSFMSFDNAVQQRILWETEYFKEYSNNYNPATQTIQLTYLNPDTRQNMFIESNLSGQILTHNKLPQQS